MRFLLQNLKYDINKEDMGRIVPHQMITSCVGYLVFILTCPEDVTRQFRGLVSSRFKAIVHFFFYS